MDKTAILFTGKIYPQTFDKLIEQTQTIRPAGILNGHLFN